jgi:hypothetical protein
LTGGDHRSDVLQQLWMRRKPYSFKVISVT